MFKPLPVTTAKYPRAFIGNNLPSRIFCICTLHYKVYILRCLVKTSAQICKTDTILPISFCNVKILTRWGLNWPLSARSTFVNTNIVRFPCGSMLLTKSVTLLLSASKDPSKKIKTRRLWAQNRHSTHLKFMSDTAELLKLVVSNVLLEKWIVTSRK